MDEIKITRICLNDTPGSSVVDGHIIFSLKMLLMVDLQPGGGELQFCATQISSLVNNLHRWDPESKKVKRFKSGRGFFWIELDSICTKWAIYCRSLQQSGMEPIKRVIRLIKIIQQKRNITVYLSLIYIRTIKIILQSWNLLCHRDFLPVLAVCYMQTYQTSSDKVNTGAVVTSKTL